MEVQELIRRLREYPPYYPVNVTAVRLIQPTRTTGAAPCVVVEVPR